MANNIFDEVETLTEEEKIANDAIKFSETTPEEREMQKKVESASFLIDSMARRRQKTISDFRKGFLDQGTDEEKRFAYVDNFVKNKFGIEGLRGIALNDNQEPYNYSAQYALEIDKILNEGFVSRFDEESLAWERAKEKGDRKEMMRLAGMDENSVPLRNVGMPLGTGADTAGMIMQAQMTEKDAKAEKSRLEDEFLSRHNEKIVAKNLFNYYAILKPYLSQESQDIFNRSLVDGERIAPEAKLHIEQLCYSGKEGEKEAEMLASLLRGSLHKYNKDGAFWADMGSKFVEGFSFVGNAIYFNERMMSDFFGKRALWRDTLTEAEQDEHGLPRNYATAEDKEYYFSLRESGWEEEPARARVKARIAERIYDSAGAKKERERERRAELLANQLTTRNHDYGFMQDTLLAVSQMLPYMGTAMFPIAGQYMVMADATQQIGDDLLLAGKDPDELLGLQIFAGVTIGLIEKMQAKALQTGYTNAYKKTLFWDMMNKVAGKKARLASFGKLAKAEAEEALVRTIGETFEETLQGGVQGGVTNFLKANGLEEAFVSALEGGIKEAWNSTKESLAPMGVISLGGVGAGAMRGAYMRKNNANTIREHIVDALRAKNNLIDEMNKIAGYKEPTPEQREIMGKLAEQTLIEAKKLLEKTGDMTKVAEILEDKYHLSQQTLDGIMKMTHQQIVLEDFARHDENDVSRALQLIALNKHTPSAHLVHGNQQYSAVEMLKAISPNLKIEEMMINEEDAKREDNETMREKYFIAKSLLAQIDSGYNIISAEQQKKAQEIVEAYEKEDPNALYNYNEQTKQLPQATIRVDDKTGDIAVECEGVAQLSIQEVLANDEGVKNAKEQLLKTRAIIGNFSKNPKKQKAQKKQARKQLERDVENLKQATNRALVPTIQEAHKPRLRERAKDPNAPKQRFYKVTVPIKQKDGTTVNKTYSINEMSGKPNIESAEFASSVENAMRGQKGAITAKKYLELSREAKEKYLNDNGLAQGGNFNNRSFQIKDENGNVLLDSNALVNIQRATGVGAMQGANWTLGHEHAHAIIRFARDIGAIEANDEIVNTMRQLFGNATAGVDELWNEEAMADAFSDYISMQTDFKKVDDKDKYFVEKIFDGVENVLAKIMDAFGIRRPMTRNKAKLRQQALTAVFEAIRTGDLSGMSPFAGIDFNEKKKDEKKKDENKKAESQHQAEPQSEEVSPDERVLQYFEPDPNARAIGIKNLKSLKVNEPEKSINNAKKFIEEALEGKRGKRKPINVVRNIGADGVADGTFTVVDGNATTHALARMGETHVLAIEIGENQLTRLRNSALQVENETPADQQEADGKLHTRNLDGLTGEAQREKAYEQAEENIQTLNDITQEVATKVGADMMVRPANKDKEGVDKREVGKAIKKRARVDEKTLADYAGDYSRCVDLIGTTLVMKDDGDYTDAVKYLHKFAEAHGATIAKVKTLNWGANAKGYRDIKVSIRFKNGGIGEVIIVEEYINNAKFNRGGHEIYEIERTLGKYKDKGNKEIDECVEELNKLTNAIYERGEGALTAEEFERAKASASISVTRLLGTPISSLLSSEDIKSLKSLSAEFHRAQPASLDSYATPAVSFIQNDINNPPINEGILPSSAGNSKGVNDARAQAEERAKNQHKANQQAKAQAQWTQQQRAQQPTATIPMSEDIAQQIKAMSDQISNQGNEIRALREAIASRGLQMQADPQAVINNIPLRTGNTILVDDPNYKMRVLCECVWIAHEDVKESTGDRSLQNRDRKRKDSTDQAFSKSRKGEFKARALSPSDLSDHGAPIVAGGNRLISGHGRRNMLQWLIDDGNFESEYLTPMLKICDRLGIPHPKEGMKHPELHLRIKEFTDEEGKPLNLSEREMHEKLVEFATLSNKSGLLQYSTSENSAKDAVVLIDNAKTLLPLLKPSASGNLLVKQNLGFMQEFLKLIGATHLTTKKGYPTFEAAQRVQQAMMSAVFGKDDIINDITDALLEDEDINLGALERALSHNAGSLLAMRVTHKASFDIVEDLKDTAKTYIAWKQDSSKTGLLDYLNQGSLFGDEPTAMQKALIQLIHNESFDQVLQKYIRAVAKQEADEQGTFAGTYEKKTPLQILAEAEREIIPRDKDGNFVRKPVTPEPDSDIAKNELPRARPPAVSLEPTVDEGATDTKTQEEDDNGEEPLTPVTPTTIVEQPTSDDKKEEPYQSKPALVVTAQSILDGTENEDKPFIPAPLVRGGIEKPIAPILKDAHGHDVVDENGKPEREMFKAYRVNSEGNPTTAIKSLPYGYWNRLRQPYNANVNPPQSLQDRDGRGLGDISRPMHSPWIQGYSSHDKHMFPMYQGYKAEMAERTTNAIANTMSKSEREHYTALADLFGGGGCWGLFHALQSFPNVKKLYINEFDAGRLYKIRLMQTLGEDIGKRCQAEILDPIMSFLNAHCHNTDGTITSSPKNIKDYVFALRALFDTNEVMKDMMAQFLFEPGKAISKEYLFLTKTDLKCLRDLTREEFDALRATIQGSEDKLGLLFAFCDYANCDQASTTDKDGKQTLKAGLDSVIEGITIDGRLATQAGQAFRDRGGQIIYHVGDAKTYFKEIEAGDKMMTVIDPPYYLTAGYDGSKVPLDSQQYGYGYGDTVNLINDLAMLGNGIIYTDEAWWTQEAYKADTQGVFFGGNTEAWQGETSTFEVEQRMLGEVMNNLDHFDVCGRVKKRQEVLGIHHGHTTEGADKFKNQIRYSVGKQDQFGRRALARAYIAKEKALSARDEKLYSALERNYELSGGSRRWSIGNAQAQQAQQEYDDIVTRYTNADGSKKAGWMKAPNGKATNLSERQWVQVRTPSFKAWFGDWENDPANASKVVDKNGEPRVLMHGSWKDFHTFDISKANEYSSLGLGFYFTEDDELAEEFAEGDAGGNVKSFFLNIRNPNYLDTKNNEEIADALIARGYDIYREKFIEDCNWGSFFTSAEQNFYTTKSSPYELHNIVKELGYDGIDGGIEVVVFSPNQIKSATDNIGTFSHEDDDTRYSVARMNGENNQGKQILLGLHNSTERTASLENNNRIPYSQGDGNSDGTRSSITVEAGLQRLPNREEMQEQADQIRSSVQRIAQKQTYRREDVAVAYVAQRIIDGRKQPTIEEIDTLLRNMGLRDKKANDILMRGQQLAEKKIANAEKQAMTDIFNEDENAIATLSQHSMLNDQQEALRRLLTMGAQIQDPDTGRKVERAIKSTEMNDLRSAHGYKAKEMMAELPISLADGIFATAEWEQQKREEADAKRKKEREEAIARGEEVEDEPIEQTESDKPTSADGIVDTSAPISEQMNALADPTYIEPTAEEREAFDALMKRANFIVSAQEEADALQKRQREDRKAQKDEAKKSESEESNTADAGSDNSSSGDGSADASDTDKADAIIPQKLLKRIAPIFEKPSVFAQFIIEWTSDKVLKEHPEFVMVSDIWKNPVALKELKQTAKHILRKLASDTLGMSYDRNLIDHQINGMDDCKTYRSLRMQIAQIYERIKARAVNMSRRKLIKNLRDNIKRTSIQSGRMNWRQEEREGKTFKATEQWARMVYAVLGMSEKSLQKLEQELTATIKGFTDREAEYGYDSNEDTRYLEAKMMLEVIGAYGGLKTRAPSVIMRASQEIMEQLNGKRAEFEAKQNELKQWEKNNRQALIDAINLGYEGQGGKQKRKRNVAKDLLELFDGNIYERLSALLNKTPEGEVKERAREAIRQLHNIITHSEQTYDVELGKARMEINRGLKECYGSMEDGANHMSEEVSDEHLAILEEYKVFTQSIIRPTYGQCLQLYASIIQSDYKDNVEKHNRASHIDALRQVLSEEDFNFHAWAVDYYLTNHTTLSDSVREVTGMGIPTMNDLYCPVKVKKDAKGFASSYEGWSPIPSALSRRIRHGLDFDESANFLAMLDESACVRANTLAFAKSGIFLQNTITHKDMLKAIAMTKGNKEMHEIRDAIGHIVMRTSIEEQTNALFNQANVGRAWIARFALSYNAQSALKQLASWGMFLALRDVGGARGLSFLLSASTKAGREAIAEMKESDGYKARYMMGWSPETRAIMNNANNGKWKWTKYPKKFYDVGMMFNKKADEALALVMGQGLYRLRQQQLHDKAIAQIMNEQNVDATTAEGMINWNTIKEEAMLDTWRTIEATQQSGRGSLQNKLQRDKQSANVAKLILMFQTSPMQQFMYEKRAFEAWRDGEKGGRAWFIRTLFINHILIPTALELAKVTINAITGGLPDDDDELKKELRDYAVSCIMGQAGYLFFYSTIAESVARFAVGDKKWKKYNQGIEVPIAGIIKTAEDAMKFVVDLGTYGSQQLDLTDFDWTNEMKLEKVLDDLGRFGGDLLAPARQVRKAIKNYSEK